MAMESSFQVAAVGSSFCEVDSLVKNREKSVSTNVTRSDCTPSPGFECNICLDFVQDPVVTLCGHLYCWPCIYKWLSLHSASSEYPDKTESQCPVCKSLISESTLVPLYGRGKTRMTLKEKSSNLDLVIPPRPQAPVSWHMIPSSPSQQLSAQPPVYHTNHLNQPPQLDHRNFRDQTQQYYYNPSPNLGFSSYNYSIPSNSVHPVVGMFGDMVYEMMFGNSMRNTYNPNVLHNSPRLTRQIMQADKSLTRVCFFLFCCIILCLLLF